MQQIAHGHMSEQQDEAGGTGQVSVGRILISAHQQKQTSKGKVGIYLRHAARAF